MNPKIKELLQLLIEKGMTQDEIMKIRDDLLSSAYETFMIGALDVLTNDDLKEIEASPTQEEANTALKKIYAEKSGKDSQAVMKEIVEKKADELIKQYSEEKTVAAKEKQEQQDIAKTQQELSSISDAHAQPDGDPQEAAKVSNWQ